MEDTPFGQISAHVVQHVVQASRYDIETVPTLLQHLMEGIVLDLEILKKIRHAIIYFVQVIKYILRFNIT